MKRIGMVGGVVLALAITASASAGNASGTTQVLRTSAPDAAAGVPTEIKVAINTGAPVVPYEYSLVNRCWFGTDKTNGRSDSYERFDLIGPWFDADGDPATVDPYAVVTVNLNPVPAGATCKVVIVKNNTTLQGSTTVYSVVTSED